MGGAGKGQQGLAGAGLPSVFGAGAGGGGSGQASSPSCLSREQPAPRRSWSLETRGTEGKEAQAGQGTREHAGPPPAETPSREHRSGALRTSLVGPHLQVATARWGLTMPPGPRADSQPQVHGEPGPRRGRAACNLGSPRAPHDPRERRPQCGGTGLVLRNHGQAGCTGGPPLHKGPLWKRKRGLGWGPAGSPRGRTRRGGAGHMLARSRCSREL